MPTARQVSGSWRSPTPRQISIAKTALFIACLAPLAHLVWGYFAEDLGANPIETITRSTGEWCLRLLMITLCVTPIRKFSGWHWLVRLRRMLGLYAFFYACLHLSTYLWLDQFFDWSGIVKDIIKRPFITVGFTAFVLLIPLAATSFNAAIRWLGGQRWQRLHRLIYLIAALGVVHYWWLVKRDITEPLIYAGILTVLLGVRVFVWQSTKMTKQ